MSEYERYDILSLVVLLCVLNEYIDFVLIKDDAVHGAFETYEQGVKKGVELFGAGPFLVRSVVAVHDPDPPNIPALSIGISLVAHS